MSLITHVGSGSVCLGLSLISVTGLVVSNGSSVVMLLLSLSGSVRRDLVDSFLAHLVELLAGVCQVESRKGEGSVRVRSFSALGSKLTFEVSKQKLGSSPTHVASAYNSKEPLEQRGRGERLQSCMGERKCNKRRDATHDVLSIGSHVVGGNDLQTKGKKKKVSLTEEMKGRISER